MNAPSPKPWPADKVERRSVASLVPYAKNARTHSDEQIDQIAASIREWGWTMPVLVDESGEIIAGHGRVMAAKRLGLADVPVMVAIGWTPAQKRAYVIADNKLAANAGWDEDVLRFELGELKLGEFDLGLVGFSGDELKSLFASGGAGLTDPDEAPPAPKNPISKLGDLWLCGEHRVLCGDATKADDVARLVGGERVDMCFTDPPYNVAYGNAGNKNKRWGPHRPILNDSLGDDFAAFISAACVNIVSSTKGAIYICMACAELDTLQKAFRDAGGKWSTFVIWAKSSFTLGRSDYQRQYEPILYGWKEGGEHFWCGDRDQGDVWFVDKPHNNALHPTMKPVALAERAIKNSSKPGDIVIDCFSGSGTTMIAAQMLGRRAFGLELDPSYVDVSVQRWQDFTGKAATLDGATFAQVAASRKPAA